MMKNILLWYQFQLQHYNRWDPHEIVEISKDEDDRKNSIIKNKNQNNILKDRDEGRDSNLHSGSGESPTYKQTALIISLKGRLATFTPNVNTKTKNVVSWFLTPVVELWGPLKRIKQEPCVHLILLFTQQITNIKYVSLFTQNGPLFLLSFVAWVDLVATSIELWGLT